MAAPNETVWGSIAGNYGRIGIYCKLTETATKVTRETQIWFWSKYSVSDTANTLYYNAGTSVASASTNRGSISISTTSDSGGWSTTNQKKIKTFTATHTKGTSSSTYKMYAKLTGVERVGSTMKVNTSCKIPALTKYTVTYNANGGTGAPSKTTGYYGKSTKLSSIKPEKDGYIFVGWATSSSATSAKYSDGGSITLTSNVTLYAVWKQNIFIVSYNLLGGEGDVEPQEKQKGVNITLSTIVPTKDGYTFAGWATSLSRPLGGTATDEEIVALVEYSSGDTYAVDANLNLSAVWIPWRHTLIFDANGGTGVPSNVPCRADAVMILPSVIPTYDKNIFKCWSTTLNSTDESEVEAQYYYPEDKYTYYQDGGTVTLYALWVEASVLLHDTGELECIEIVEDNECAFYNDGKVHCSEFIEGSTDGFTTTHFGFIEFIEK